MQSTRHPMPLRRTLVGTTLAVITFAAALLGTLYVTSTTAILLDHVDERVHKSIDRLDKPKYDEPDTNAQAIAERLLMNRGPGNPDFVLAIDASGQSYAATIDSGTVETVSNDVTESLVQSPPTGELITVELSDELGQYRLSAGADTFGNTVVLGASLAETNGIVREAIAAAIWTGVGVVLVSSIIVLTLVRRALRPLEEIVETASAVSRSDPVRDPLITQERVPSAASDERSEAGRVGASLNRMLDHISEALMQREATEQRLRVFVADASHELRTPLASIRGYAELTRLSGEQIPPDSAQALQRIEEESARMSLIVEDLLLLARIDQRAPRQDEPIDLSSVLRDTVADARVSAPHHRIDDSEIEPELRMTGDEAQIRQAVGNIISNAWRHTPEGTRIAVSARSADGWLCVSVSDAGPGLPADLTEAVFERFVRADESRSREYGGTGLGLAIARSVVEAHAGTISVTSVPGDTTFTMRFPQLVSSEL